MSALTTRVRRLEAGRPPAPGDCPSVLITAVVAKGEPVPADAERCRQCGRPHILEVEEIVVTARPDIAPDLQF